MRQKLKPWTPPVATENASASVHGLSFQMTYRLARTIRQFLRPQD